MGWLADTIMGIGDRAEEALQEAGVATAAALRRIDPVAVAARTGLAVTTLETARWVAERVPDDLRARSLELARDVSGIGAKRGAVLWALGVRGLRDLRRLRPDDLDLTHLPRVTRDHLRRFQDMAHLQSLPGMTARCARRLAEAGWSRPWELAGDGPDGSGPGGVSTLPGVPGGLIDAWRRIAAGLPQGFDPDDLACDRGIVGIGVKWATALYSQGIRTLDDLRSLEPESAGLDWLPGLTRASLHRWRSMAVLQLLRGVGASRSRLLVDSGFHTWDDLLRGGAEDIHHRLLETAAEAEEALAHLPSPADMTDWVRQAFERRVGELAEALNDAADRARQGLEETAAAVGGAPAEAVNAAEQRLEEAAGWVEDRARELWEALPKGALLDLLQGLEDALEQFAQWAASPQRVADLCRDAVDLGGDVCSFESDLAAYLGNLGTRAAQAGEVALTDAELQTGESLRQRATALRARLQPLAQVAGGLESFSLPQAGADFLETSFSVLELLGLGLALDAVARLGGLTLTDSQREEMGRLDAAGLVARIRDIQGPVAVVERLLRDKLLLMDRAEAGLADLLAGTPNPGVYLRPAALGSLQAAVITSSGAGVLRYGALATLLLAGGLVALGACVCTGGATAGATVADVFSVGT